MKTVNISKCVISILVLILIFIIPAEAQWEYPNYNVEKGSYDDCSQNKMNFSVPNVITTESDQYNTKIHFNLLPSKLQAGLYISLEPGIEINANCDPAIVQSTELSISNSYPCRVTILNSINATIPLYDKIELGIRPSDNNVAAINNFFSNSIPINSKINPYNPDAQDQDYIQVEVTFTSPTNVEHQVYGFYYREYCEDLPLNVWHEIPTEYPFRARFSPDEIGIWDVKVNIFSNVEVEGFGIDPSCTTTYNSLLNAFYCAPSNEKSYLEKGIHNTTLRFANPNHESFFATAFNVAQPYGPTPVPHLEDYIRQRNYIKQAVDYGVNYIRISAGADAYGIEWENLGVYDKFIYSANPSLIEHRNRQENAWELDRTVDLARLREIYLQLVLDGSFSQSTDPYWAWQNNPYYTLPTVFNQLDYFTDPTVRKYINRKLRYTMARWGYSSHLATFEIGNEISNWNGYSSNIYNVESFYLQSSKYLKDDLLSNKLHTVSFSKIPDLSIAVLTSPYIDICDVHMYGSNKIDNYKKRANTFEDLRAFGKPAFCGEMGAAEVGGIDPRLIEGCNDNMLHDAIWSTAFMGGMGIGANWWWFDDAISDNQYDKNFVELATFMNTIDFEDNKFSPGKWNNSRRLSWDIVCGGNWEHVNYTLENYYMINDNGKRCIGWCHNTTWYWGNLISSNTCGVPLIPPCDDDWYPVPLQLPNAKVKINGLNWPLRKYSYDIYKTTGGILGNLSSMFWRHGNKLTSPLGTLSVRMLNDLVTYPDYCYKAYRKGNNFREIEDSSEIAIDSLELFFDTLCVNEQVFISGNYEDDTLHLYNYFWHFGDGSTSNEEHPKFSYSNPGNYTVYVKVIDTIGSIIDSVGMYYTVVACNDSLNFNSNKSLQNKSNQSDFRLNPNPTNGQFKVLNINEQEYDLFIYDLTGNIIYSKLNINSDVFNINIDNYLSGMYLVRINTLNDNVLFKIILL